MIEIASNIAALQESEGVVDFGSVTPKEGFRWMTSSDLDLVHPALHGPECLNWTPFAVSDGKIYYQRLSIRVP